MRKAKTIVSLTNSNALAQDAMARHMFNRMLEIARECGGTLGEGALCDYLEMTPAQIEVFNARCAAEFKTNG
jgi:hypothetical protein